MYCQASSKKIITLGIEQQNNPASHQLGEKYGELGIVKYVDSSYAGDLENKKLITRYCFFFGRAIITWYSKQQYTVSIFISKAKYVAISQCIRENVQIQQFLNKLLPENAVREMKMLSDNEISLTLTKNPKSQNQTKYIDVIYHYIHKLINDRELAIEQIKKSAMLADGLIKTFPIGSFKKY